MAQPAPYVFIYFAHEGGRAVGSSSCAIVKAVYKEPSVSFCQLQTQQGHGSSVSHWARKPTRPSEPGDLFPQETDSACLPLLSFPILPPPPTPWLLACLCPPWEGGLCHLGMAARQNLTPWPAWIPIPGHQIPSAPIAPREKAMRPSVSWHSSQAPAKPVLSWPPSHTSITRQHSFWLRTDPADEVTEDIKHERHIRAASRPSARP